MAPETKRQLPAVLSEELCEVHHHLLSIVSDLDSPLRDLIKSQLESSRPYLRAAVALAAGVPVADRAEVRKRRIYVGTAIELLHVALAIHKHLLSDKGGDGHAADKMWTGSLILAGDYCFSRAAAYAAQTNYPGVVEIFAVALKDISEGYLRNILAGGDSRYDETMKLCVAGCEAAVEIAELSRNQRSRTVEYCRTFTSWYDRYRDRREDGRVDSHPAALVKALDKLLPEQQQRWRAIIDGLVL